MAMNLHYPGDVKRKQPNQSGVPRIHASLHTVRYRTSVNPVDFCSILGLMPCYICVEHIFVWHVAGRFVEPFGHREHREGQGVPSRVAIVLAW